MSEALTTLPARDGDLRRALERDFAHVGRRAGAWLVCRPGCDGCCRSLFPVTRLDALRLRVGLERLAAEEPQAAAVVRRRASAQTERLGSELPLHDTAGLDRLFAEHPDEVCPVLDETTGHCRLYEHRPVACRSYGPPLRFEGREAGHCKLCFQGAPSETVEACRYTPDREGLERELLREIGAPEDEAWSDLICTAISVGAFR